MLITVLVFLYFHKKKKEFCIKIRSTSPSRSIEAYFDFFFLSILFKLFSASRGPFFPWYLAARKETRLKKRSVNTTRSMRFVQSTVHKSGRRLHLGLFRPMAEVSFPPSRRIPRKRAVSREFKLSTKVEKEAFVNIL